MNERAIEVAKERQLDGLLGEVLGTAPPARAAAPGMVRWLVAAFVTLALGAAVGTALLRDDSGTQPVQEPSSEPEWTECHGVAALAAVPADVIALKCFDFDDAACAQLVRFTKLERLDLSGSDVNDKGYSVPPRITDKGVRELAVLASLRSLCLARCHDMKGEGLQALEALPKLEHLDLTYSGVETAAVERLPRLPGLRSLVLSGCLNFHGRALEAVAKIPGLRRLELSGCPTLSAKDALHLVASKDLRYLDLRDCQGRYRGQRGDFAGTRFVDTNEDGIPDQRGEPDGSGKTTFVDTDKDGIPDKRVEPPAPPVEDGIGITDEVVIALSALPLETFLLGGSESLTDAIGPALAKMTTLRALDVSFLPKVTPALLEHVPHELVSLALDDNRQFANGALARLPALPRVTELGLRGITLGDGELDDVLRGKSLHVLRLGRRAPQGKGGEKDVAPDWTTLGAAAGKTVAAHADLRRLELQRAQSVEPAFLRALATLRKLTDVDFQGSAAVNAATLRGLADCRALRSVSLSLCTTIDGDAIEALRDLPLRELDLYGTKCDPARVQELAAKHWRGCVITMPKDARRWRVP